MRYCSILALKRAREQGRNSSLCCDSESAKRGDQRKPTKNSWGIVFLLIILVTFLCAAVIGAI